MTWPRNLYLLGLICFLYSPAIFAQTVSVSPSPTPTPSASLSAEEKLYSKSQEEILQEADEIFKEVSRLRGLPIKAPVKKEFKDKVFFRQYFERLLHEKYPPGEKEATEKAYSILGLLPEKTDLIQAYLESFLQVVEGLYDPPTKTLY